MTERFAKWKFPAIKEGCLTKYHWLVQHKDKLKHRNIPDNVRHLVSRSKLSKGEKRKMSSNNKRIFLSPPHMGGQEIGFVKEAFESNYIAPLGPHVDAFELEFSEIVGIPHAAAVSSGTSALHLALRLLGVGPGDDVFAPSFTFICGNGVAS